METKEVILKRRSIRKFQSELIDNKILEEAIYYATQAPSAHNYQPWKFQILNNEQKNQIANELIKKTSNLKDSTSPHTASIIKEAPNSILIYYDDNGENRDLNIISIGAAIENMILYLEDKNIGTLWVGNTNYIKEEIKKITKINLEPISMILIGKKNQEPHQRPRKQFEDIIIK